MIDEWSGTAWDTETPHDGPAKAVTGNFAAHVEFGTYLSPAARTPQAMMVRAQAAYHSNPWIGTAESTVSRRVAGLPWHLEDENDEEYEFPYPPEVQAAFDLLEKPQSALPPEMRDPGLLTRRALVAITSRHIGLCGMSYWFLDQPDINGIPLAILYVNPARVWAATTETGRITGWLLDPKDSQGRGGIPLSLSELLPFYLDPPDRGPYGTGLYERAALKAQISTLADQHSAYVLGTGGRLAGIVAPKEGTIPDEQYKVLVNEFRQVNEAPDAAKRTTILRGPIDFTQTAANPEQLSLIDLSKMNRDDIFGIWGVPPSQAGITSKSEGGLNSGETRKYDEATLMQGAVHDRIVSISETVQFGLLDRWLNIGTTIDLEIEEPTFDDRAPVFTIAQSAISLPLKNAERRELVGLPPFGPKVMGSSGGLLDEEVWMPALQSLAFTGAEGVSNEPAPTPPQLVPFGKAAPRKEFLGLRKNLDGRWVPAVQKVLNGILETQRSEVAAKLRASTPDEFSRQRKNRQHWFDRAKEAERMRKALSPIVATIAEMVGKRTDELLREKVGAKADPFTDAVIAKVATKVGARVQGITDTTQQAIADAIAQGFDDGLSPGEIADLIDALPAFDDARAELVARTETMYAYNAAALDSFGEFGVSEVEAIDGEGDEECADRNGQIFSVEEADSIEDHPNGTLDWMPVIPEDFVSIGKGQPVDIPELVKAILEAQKPVPMSMTILNPESGKAIEAPAPEIHYEYGENGLVSGMTTLDAGGRLIRTSYEYGENGQVLSTRNAFIQTEHRTPDELALAMQAHGESTERLGESTDRLGHSTEQLTALTQRLAEVAERLSQPVRKTPIRDETGRITEVIETRG